MLIAAGSGITPVLSIAASALADPASEATLLYGNRRAESVMFADEIADLKDSYPVRLQLAHVLSREAQEVELFSGRLDADRLRRLLPALCDVAGIDHWWLCGPYGMVTDAMAVLAELGVPAGRVHRELFYVEDIAAGAGAARGEAAVRRLRGDDRPRRAADYDDDRRRTRRCSTGRSWPGRTCRSRARAASAGPAGPGRVRRGADAAQFRAGAVGTRRGLRADLPVTAGLCEKLTVDYDA